MALKSPRTGFSHPTILERAWIEMTIQHTAPLRINPGPVCSLQSWTPGPLRQLFSLNQVMDPLAPVPSCHSSHDACLAWKNGSCGPSSDECFLPRGVCSRAESMSGRAWQDMLRKRFLYEETETLIHTQLGYRFAFHDFIILSMINLLVRIAAVVPTSTLMKYDNL